jgi:mannose-6-phosphate isomerase-like protein (cupin superfamily)
MSPEGRPNVKLGASKVGSALLIGGASEAGAGDIVVIKAGEVHGFRCIGDGPLVQLDVHLSPRFIQENLG